MARIIWKENAVISIETRKGIFVLGQMSKSPYIVFFNLFSTDDSWVDIDLNRAPILFCKAVTRQFLKQSNIKKQADIFPCTSLDLPKYWIKIKPGSRKVKVWEGTKYEREIISLAGMPCADLIENDIAIGGFQDYPVITQNISLNDDVLDKYETTSISIYPELNERLYLCYQLGEVIDPMKYIDLEKDIPIVCERYVDIVSGKVALSKLDY